MVRAIASEPRRPVAIRALPLPNSILLARNWGFPRLFRGRPILCRILSSFFACPPSQIGTPTGQKADNRSLAYLLSNLTSCISRSKPWHIRPLLSHSASTTYAHSFPEKPAPSFPTWGFSLSRVSSHQEERSPSRTSPALRQAIHARERGRCLYCLRPTNARSASITSSLAWPRNTGRSLLQAESLRARRRAVKEGHRAIL